MKTLEAYIHKQIKEIEQQLANLQTNRKDYSEEDYNGLFSRYSGQIDILYKCLSAHDNTYNQDQHKL